MKLSTKINLTAAVGFAVVLVCGILTIGFGGL